jgi:hypothetical protein
MVKEQYVSRESVTCIQITKAGLEGDYGRNRHVVRRAEYDSCTQANSRRLRAGQHPREIMDSCTPSILSQLFQAL